MKALLAGKPGGPEVLTLGETDKPTPGPGQILVKVMACGLNPVDYKIRSGYFSEGRKYPAIYGFDVAGVVEATGGGAATFKKGDEVFYFADLAGQGAYAEYHAVREEIVARKPACLSFVDAASLPLAGGTAWQGLFGHGDLRFGESVAIFGAAGGVGSLATQMAKWKGATVYGVCSGANFDYVRSLGAEHAVDYAVVDPAEEILRLTGGRGVDVAFDLVGKRGFTGAIESLAKRGRLVFLNAVLSDFEETMMAINSARIKNISIHCELVQTGRETTRALAWMVENGFLKPQVARIIPLGGVPDAHRQLETMRGRGKTVVDMTLPIEA